MSYLSNLLTYQNACLHKNVQLWTLSSAENLHKKSSFKFNKRYAFWETAALLIFCLIEWGFKLALVLFSC